MANMAANTVKANLTGSPAAPTDATVAALTTAVASGLLAGPDRRRLRVVSDPCSRERRLVPEQVRGMVADLAQAVRRRERAVIDWKQRVCSAVVADFADPPSPRNR